ncbi:enolase-phosphatase E1 isoform X2 [Drosophila mauritiana]|uniref:Enolase-phosphatase E1 isoform X2 n=1 Tax=Drosophila mauritiana TaxID=7226 RepID=A0A6P8K9E3_DROMA|nr:enolase-phosphatase E1 isoform X2 [Drosophila mauritiana]
MVLDIKMCRFDNVPWGFRLVGGADYDYPLTVVKVTEGSIADEAGLRVEDIIVRINDTAAMPLTHDEAHRLIMGSGSVFYFGVYRENEEDAYECLKKFPTSEGSLTMSPMPTISPSPTPSLTQLTETTNARTPEPKPFVPLPREHAAATLAAPAVEVDVDVLAECRQAVSEVHSEEKRGDVNGHDAPAQAEEGAHPVETLYLPDLPDRPCSALSERQEIKLVEEEIAAVLSGESEVLKEHNVLGIFPKPGVCMSSDVLRSINEEVTKTKLEKDKENRQWSTFLQRPNRPVPKSKQSLEAERRAANAYKVTIVKSAPREKSPMPEAKPAPKEATPPKEEEKKEEEPVPQEVVEPEPEPEKDEEPLPTDSEVPNLEQLPETELPDEQPEKGDAPKEVCEPEVVIQTEPGSPDGNEASDGPAGATPPAEPITPVPVKSEEELALERQLADVQRQLAALSSLPSTIQSTLDAVTKQLADLLPTFKLQQQEKQLPQIDENSGSEQKDVDGVTTTTNTINTAGETEDAGKDISISGSDNPPVGPCESNEDRCDANDREVAEISRSTDDNRLAKDKKMDLDQEQQQQQQEPLSEEQNFKKQKIAFWNRLFNGEHITRQRFRELQGLGLTMQKVNFMKYQKPERKIDLNRSEVYKYLNPHLDRAPVRGIEVRAPLVAAESDIRQSLQS